MALRNLDMELQDRRKRYVNGYPSLAAFIARDKDYSTSVYRGYHRLAARNILYLEAELFELEQKQDAFDEEDLKGDLTAKQYARSWTTLNLSGNSRCIERKEHIQKIRVKMKEYQEALIYQEAILNMKKPHRRTVEAFSAWMNGEADGRGVSVLSDINSKRLDDADDLVALHAPTEQDWLIRFVRRYLRILFVEGELDGSLAYFSERRVAYAVATLGVLIAAILLVGAIINLYLVQNNNIRLGLIGGYTAGFALSVGVLTNARRAELFASTAAYAAVLVVFVSGNLGTPVTT